MIGLGKRLMGKPPSGVDLKAKAIAVWEFDETSGMIAYDSHGSHDGTMYDGRGDISTGITVMPRLGTCILL